MVITGMALRRPDKTGHYRTLGQKALETDAFALSQMSDKAEGYSLVKELLARPQRRVREKLDRGMLNAEC